MQTKYNIKIHKRVEKFLAIHPEMLKAFFQALEILADDIQTREIDIKTLAGLSGNHFRLRI
jgi:mRNA-degrading endonuclease RelE of RelBE toxin-antitoxin system